MFKEFMTMPDYKLRWDDIEGHYEVYNLRKKKEMPTIPVPIEGRISETALSTLLQKLILHANQSGQTLSDSCVQLAGEIAYLYSDEMAMLKSTKESDLDKLTTERMTDLMVGAAVQVKDILMPVVEKIDSLREDAEELAARLPKAVLKPVPTSPNPEEHLE